MIKILICVLLIFLLLNIITYSAPVEITIEYGNETVPCTPTTCTALGKNCGSWDDGCSGTLNCGTCSTGQTCNNGVCSSSSPGGSPGSSYNPISQNVVNVSNKTISEPKKEVPPVPQLKESSDIKITLSTIDEIEAGEPFIINVTISSKNPLSTSVKIFDIEKEISLGTEESKTLSFEVYAPETEGSYNLVATTPYATGNKTINLIYKPLFLYVNQVGNQTYEIHLKNFEDKSTTEIEVIRNNIETVFIDALSNKVDYRINLTLTPGDYIFKAKTFSGSSILDEDTRTIKIEGNPAFNYGNIVLGAVVIIILITSIILFSSKKVS